MALELAESVAGQAREDPGQGGDEGRQGQAGQGQPQVQGQEHHHDAGDEEDVVEQGHHRGAVHLV